METTWETRSSTGQLEPPRFTVLGLFDDAIDAEHTLVALRRADRPAEQVSVLVRDRAADASAGSERQGEVGRAVVANALSAVGGWLLGLAALIVPDNGTYLVAGPIGAALAGVKTIEEHNRQRAREEGIDLPDPVSEQRGNGVHHTLTEFGFRPEEATYLHSRLAAGSALIAVTTSDSEQLQATRRLFADHSAVHIGQAQTQETIVHEAEELLAVPLAETDTGDVVIADAVAPLLHLCTATLPNISTPTACGSRVLDVDGEEVGEIDDLLATNPAGAQAGGPDICYVVISYGGLLGIGRHRSAIPCEQVDLTAEPIRLSITKEIVRRAPSYDPDLPFSRREEMAVNAYFGTAPYWLRGESGVEGR